MELHRLFQRAAIIQAVRFFFMGRDYLEVETPIRLPALIPEAHIHPVASGDWFLQTSPELCMKRLLAAGASPIFQICKCFRGRERGGRHLPEFTMLEWYRLGGDYQDLMTETQELLITVAQQLAGKKDYNQEVVKQLSSNDWQRLTVAEAFSRYAPVSVEKAMADDRFEELLVEHVEPHLGAKQPCFLYDYPLALGSLAKKNVLKPEVAERFELYVGGVELANGFSELTDVVEQRERFHHEADYARRRGTSFGRLPEKFLADLDRIRSACGIALGIDRLVMLLVGAESIDEVVSFTPEDL